MNRYTLPRGMEDALLRRAEQYQELGDFVQAREYRRLAGSARRAGSALSGGLNRKKGKWI